MNDTRTGAAVDSGAGTDRRREPVRTSCPPSSGDFNGRGTQGVEQAEIPFGLRCEAELALHSRPSGRAEVGRQQHIVQQFIDPGGQ